MKGKSVRMGETGKVSDWEGKSWQREGREGLGWGEKGLDWERKCRLGKD